MIDLKIKTSFVGPPLEKGKLPACIYLALSDHDSLHLDPFNQFVTHFKGKPVRVFSFMIPGHEPGRKKEEAIAYFAERLQAGDDVITDFIEKAADAIHEILEKYATKVTLAGLSRGAYLALHIAARVKQVKTVLGFAPLTELGKTREFVDFDPAHLSLYHHIDALSEKTLRFYIGNRDLRVGTDRLFALVSELADHAYKKRIRASPIEMLVGPSYGSLGHGTPPEIFAKGAQWMLKHLL